MDWPTYLDTVLTSRPEQWARIGVRPGGPPDAAGYDVVATFRPNLAISLAWPIEIVRDFMEPWALKWPAKHATSFSVDWRYHGVCVHRVPFVAVDGCRAYLPMAGEPDLTVVPARYSQFMRLFSTLAGVGPQAYDTYLHMAGFVTTDEPWPVER
jgi:hypothetical protein